MSRTGVTFALADDCQASGEKRRPYQSVKKKLRYGTTDANRVNLIAITPGDTTLREFYSVLQFIVKNPAI